MQAMCIWIKENRNCASKLTDVVSRPESSSKKRGCSSGEENADVQHVHHMPNPFCKVLFRPKNQRAQFCGLGIEDPSRNIVEMIFRRASIDPTKPLRNVERAIRVKNTPEVIERFERYREVVMKKASEQAKEHPRSVVDGNEMLLFYSTTMTCCYGKRTKKVSELCKYHTCTLCRLIQAKFNTEDTRRKGIRLGVCCEGTGDNTFSLRKVKHMRRAVVLCRVIAGRIMNQVDGALEEWDSIGEEGVDSNLQHLTVQNPCSILPCFIIVFA